jgi:hypothetical protein
MGSTDWDRDEVGKALLRSVEGSRIKDYIRKPLEEIIDPLSKGEAIDAGLSMDVMMVLVFIHIDLMGYLYTADPSPHNSSKNAVKFLREYLGRIDARYKEVGGLLYHMLRHGWIHKHIPKRLRMSDGTILDFLYSFNMDREQHLRKTAEIEGTTRLHISVSLLYNDLLSALDLFAEDVQHNQELSDVFKKAFETRREPEEEDKLRTKYKQDIDFIRHLLGDGN